MKNRPSNQREITCRSEYYQKFINCVSAVDSKRLNLNLIGLMIMEAHLQ